MALVAVMFLFVAQHPFGSEVSRWLAQSDVSVQTKKRYREDLEHMLKELTEQGADPNNLDPGDAADYMAAMADRVAPATFNFRLMVAQSFHSYLVRVGSRTQNPFAGIARLVETKVQRDAFDLAELRDLLRLARNDRERAIVALMGIAALLLDDVLQSRVDDLVLDKDPPVLRIRPRRGWSGGEMPLPPVCVDALIGCVAGRSDGYLILAKSGKQLDRQVVGRIVAALAKRAGISRPVVPAMLTHTQRNIAIEYGFSVRSMALSFPDGGRALNALIRRAMDTDGPAEDGPQFRVAALVAHDIATDRSLLTQAERLLYAPDVHPAAAAWLAGAVLERHLRHWVEEKGSVVRGRPTIVSLATALRRERFISEQDFQGLHDLAADRDKAAHGRFIEVDEALARAVIDRVRTFLLEHPVAD